MKTKCRYIVVSSIPCIMLLWIILFFSCEKIGSFLPYKKKGKLHEYKHESGIQSICIGNDIPVTTEPDAGSSVILFLSLGETMYWTEKTLVDSMSKKEYYNVILSDLKTSGWVWSLYLVPYAQIGVLKNQVQIYKRPDSITVTEKRFHFMDMVALTDNTKQWIHAIGENREQTGWIKRDDVILNKEDVASAIFARKKLREINPLTRKEKLDYIILNAPFADSYFVEEIRKMSALEDIFESENINHE